MLSFPNAKINLGLNVISRRPDGYHEMESCLYPIPWKDVLEITPSDEFAFESTGLNIPGKPEENLCVKAYQLLRAEYNLSNVHIQLHKVVPMGAGLGGGSSDGAFALKLLNDLFELNVPKEHLEKFASKLGSDCPFFISNQPALATGTGTSLAPLNVNLSGYYLAIKHPGIHIGTKEAYNKIVPTKPVKSIPETLSLPIDQWKNYLKNDFEESLFPSHPKIAKLKSDLYHLGAVYAAMSGSGSAVFGLFQKKPEAKGFDVFQL